MPPRLELSEIKDSIVFHAAAFFLAASLATAAAARPKNNHATCSIAISLLTFISRPRGWPMPPAAPRTATLRAGVEPDAAAAAAEAEKPLAASFANCGSRDIFFGFGVF